MTPVKRLNLSKSYDDESSASSSNDEPEKAITLEKEHDSSSDEESEAEFEIPPGFESVKGSGAVTRETVFNNDQELWFFKLPKNLDASVLANVKIKVDEDKTPTRGEVLATIEAGKPDKKYILRSEDGILTDQLVNALPLASNRAQFMLGKPFTRCFSLVEDYLDGISATKAMKKEAIKMRPKSEKRKKKHAIDKHKAKRMKHKT